METGTVAGLSAAATAALIAFANWVGKNRSRANGRDANGRGIPNARAWFDLLTNIEKQLEALIRLQEKMDKGIDKIADQIAQARLDNERRHTQLIDRLPPR